MSENILCTTELLCCVVGVRLDWLSVSRQKIHEYVIFTNLYLEIVLKICQEVCCKKGTNFYACMFPLSVEWLPYIQQSVKYELQAYLNMQLYQLVCSSYFFLSVTQIGQLKSHRKLGWFAVSLTERCGESMKLRLRCVVSGARLYDSPSPEVSSCFYLITLHHLHCFHFLSTQQGSEILVFFWCIWQAYRLNNDCLPHVYGQAVP